MADCIDEPVVGGRCLADGFFGTVRFVGEVPPTPGTWVGVEWDDPTRGKHCGVHDNVRYFTCREPNSGSFVRPKKLFYGRTFIQALKRRYGTKFDNEYSEHDLTMSGKKVEFVGMDKVHQTLSCYQNLTDVGLDGMKMGSAGPEGEIQSIAPNITALNIADNPLLNSWEQVAGIGRQLKCLHELNVSNNQLAIPGDMTVLSPAFKMVTVLVMNKMSLHWEEVLRVVAALPQLVELHTCQNKISTLKCHGYLESGLPVGLQLLNLEENCLSRWSDILLLGKLTRLNKLILSDNSLAEVSTPDASEGLFPALETLSLNNNLIHGWSSVNAMNSLSALRKLRFKNNPVLNAEGQLASRQLVIARLSGITDLNLSKISKQERMDSEIYYVKHYAADWQRAVNGGDDRFASCHPQFARLMKLHSLEEEALLSAKPTTATVALKNRLLLLTITCPETPDASPITKKVPDTMTVQKLKGLLQRLCKVAASDQHLSYTCSKSEAEFDMPDDMKQLSFYSVKSGDTIILRTHH